MHNRFPTLSYLFVQSGPIHCTLVLHQADNTTSTLRDLTRLTDFEFKFIINTIFIYSDQPRLFWQNDYWALLSVSFFIHSHTHTHWQSHVHITLLLCANWDYTIWHQNLIVLKLFLLIYHYKFSQNALHYQHLCELRRLELVHTSCLEHCLEKFIITIITDI